MKEGSKDSILKWLPNLLKKKKWASQVALFVKNPPTNKGDRDSIRGLGRSPGGGHGNLLQYFCLEDPKDGGAWQALVHRVTKESDTTEAT